jgi:hypothetical protein
MSNLAVKSDSKRGVDTLVASFFKLEGFATKLPGQYKIQLKALVSEIKAFAIKQFKEIVSENEWLRQQNDVLIKENDATKVNKTFENAVVRASVSETLIEESELLPVRSSHAQKIISDPVKQVSTQWQEEPTYKAQKASLISEAASNDNSNSYNLDDYLAKFSKRYDVPNDFHEANNVWTHVKNQEEQVLQDATAFKGLPFDPGKALLPSLAPFAELVTCTALATISIIFGGGAAENEDAPQPLAENVVRPVLEAPVNDWQGEFGRSMHNFTAQPIIAEANNVPPSEQSICTIMPGVPLRPVIPEEDQSSSSDAPTEPVEPEGSLASVVDEGHDAQQGPYTTAVMGGLSVLGALYIYSQV